MRGISGFGWRRAWRVIRFVMFGMGARRVGRWGFWGRSVCILEAGVVGGH
jgi:hypothetical protein